MRHLDVVKKKVDASACLDDAKKAALKAELDGYMATLQADHDAIVASQGKEGVRNASKQAVADWNTIRPQVKRIAGEILAGRLDCAIEKANNASAKVDTTLVELKNAGKDTTALEPLVATFKTKLSTAQADYDSAVAKLAEVRTAADTKAALNDADRLLRKAAKDLVQVQVSLRAVLHEIFRLENKTETVPDAVELNESAPTAVEED